MEEKQLNYMSMKKFTNIFIVLLACLHGCTKADTYTNFNTFSGSGGSMARFAIQDDILYTVSADTLKLFDLSESAHPKYMSSKDQKIGSNIETVFPLDTLLFIGSQEGMYLYNIVRPKFPSPLGMVAHIRSCDPVVAQGHYAYVTLNTNNSWCGTSFNNVLQVYDISDPLLPVMERSLNLSGPQGLGIDGNKLFVCDRGLKVYDISQPQNPVWVDDLEELAETDVRTAYDVIPVNGLLILVSGEGLYQFDYTGDKLKFISKLTK
jgi:hypothetical protein